MRGDLSCILVGNLIFSILLGVKTLIILLLLELSRIRCLRNCLKYCWEIEPIRLLALLHHPSISVILTSTVSILCEMLCSYRPKRPGLILKCRGINHPVRKRRQLAHRFSRLIIKLLMLVISITCSSVPNSKVFLVKRVLLLFCDTIEGIGSIALGLRVMH
jgi:hypothetical protein